ncbi:MAG: MEDS domain-containing protein [Deltaproteobacteria bacterium]|nr:MEDS domain-containing protein [Deltaproteobacteria bacterium]
MNIKDAAEFLNVSEMTIRRWTNSEKLKCYRLGGRRERRFRKSDLEEFLQGSQYYRLKPLGFGGHLVPDGSHLTNFYTGKEEGLSVSIPYLLEAVREGESVLAVMPPERSKELLKKLKGEGHPVGLWLQNGRLNITTGMDSPDRMIRYLKDFADKTPKFRVLGDMIWTLRKGWNLTALRAFEEIPSLMPPVKNGLLLCQYSLDEVSGAHIMMAAEVHRHMIYKGRMEKSPYYAFENNY